MPHMQKKIVGYEFYIYQGRRGFARKPATIYNKDIKEALAKFIRLALDTSIHPFHMGLRTVERKKNVRGNRAIITGELLQVNYQRRPIKFKIEPIYGDTDGE